VIETLQIVVCRKPLEGSVVDNVLENGVGSINIEGCRIESNGESFVINTWNDGSKPFGGGAGHAYTSRQSSGRWPSNVILEEGVDRVFPLAFNQCGSPKKTTHDSGMFGIRVPGLIFKEKSDSASRFFWSFDSD